MSEIKKTTESIRTISIDGVVADAARAFTILLYAIAIALVSLTIFVGYHTFAVHHEHEAAMAKNPS